MTSFLTSIYDGLMGGVAALWQRPKNELIRFFLNQNIAPYLKDNIQRNEFETRFQVGATLVSFTRFDLDERVLNQKFGAALPFALQSGTVADIEVYVPWSDLSTEKVCVRVGEAHLTLTADVAAADALVRDAHAMAAADASGLFRSSDSASSAMDSSKRSQQSAADSVYRDPFFGNHSGASSLNTSFDAADADAALGLGRVESTKSSLEHLFGHLFANLQVSIGELRVTIVDESAASIELSVKELLYNSSDDNNDVDAVDDTDEHLHMAPISKTVSFQSVELRGVRSTLFRYTPTDSDKYGVLFRFLPSKRRAKQPIAAETPSDIEFDFRCNSSFEFQVNVAEMRTLLRISNRAYAHLDGLLEDNQEALLAQSLVFGGAPDGGGGGADWGVGANSILLKYSAFAPPVEATSDSMVKESTNVLVRANLAAVRFEITQERSLPLVVLVDTVTVKFDRSVEVGVQNVSVQRDKHSLFSFVDVDHDGDVAPLFAQIRLSSSKSSPTRVLLVLPTLSLNVADLSRWSPLLTLVDVIAFASHELAPNNSSVASSVQASEAIESAGLVLTLPSRSEFRLDGLARINGMTQSIKACVNDMEVTVRDRGRLQHRESCTQVAITLGSLHVGIGELLELHIDGDGEKKARVEWVRSTFPHAKVPKPSMSSVSSASYSVLRYINSPVLDASKVPVDKNHARKYSNHYFGCIIPKVKVTLNDQVFAASFGVVDTSLLPLSSESSPAAAVHQYVTSSCYRVVVHRLSVELLSTAASRRGNDIERPDGVVGNVYERWTRNVFLAEFRDSDIFVVQNYANTEAFVLHLDARRFHIVGREIRENGKQKSTQQLLVCCAASLPRFAPPLTTLTCEKVTLSRASVAKVKRSKHSKVIKPSVTEAVASSFYVTLYDVCVSPHVMAWTALISAFASSRANPPPPAPDSVFKPSNGLMSVVAINLSLMHTAVDVAASVSAPSARTSDNPSSPKHRVQNQCALMFSKLTWKQLSPVRSMLTVDFVRFLIPSRTAPDPSSPTLLPILQLGRRANSTDAIEVSIVSDNSGLDASNVRGVGVVAPVTTVLVDVCESGIQIRLRPQEMKTCIRLLRSFSTHLSELVDNEMPYLTAMTRAAHPTVSARDSTSSMSTNRRSYTTKAGASRRVFVSDADAEVAEMAKSLVLVERLESNEENTNARGDLTSLSKVNAMNEYDGDVGFRAATPTCTSSAPPAMFENSDGEALEVANLLADTEVVIVDQPTSTHAQHGDGDSARRFVSQDAGLLPHEEVVPNISPATIVQVTNLWLCVTLVEEHAPTLGWPDATSPPSALTTAASAGTTADSDWWLLDNASERSGARGDRGRSASVFDDVVFNVAFSVLRVDLSAWPEPREYAKKSPLYCIDAKVIRLEIFDNVQTSSWRRLLGTMDANEVRRLSSSRRHCGLVGDEVARVRLSAWQRFVPSGGDNGVSDHSGQFWLVSAAMAPLRAYVNQVTIDHVSAFIPDSEEMGEQAATSPNDGRHSEPTSIDRTAIFMESCQLGPVALLFDYKPHPNPRRTFSTVRRDGNYVLLAQMIPVEECLIELRSIPVGLADAIPIDEFPSRLAEAYAPNLGNSQLWAYLSGIQPVRVMVRLGHGALSLVRMPIDEYYKEDGSVVEGFVGGLKTLSVEVLSLGSRVSSLTYKALRHADTSLQMPPQNEEERRERARLASVSPYANAPHSVGDGLRQGR